ncbi:MAG TPA: hypothetical protein VHE30_20865 [Polyangiaceae bacterium]|nr:hypothetical protein [Polyangiaceae bacterium]
MLSVVDTVPTSGELRRRRKPPWLVIVSTAVMLLLAGGAVAAYVLMGPAIRDRVVQEAKKRGVELAFSDVDFWWWTASLHAVRFRLAGVPGIEGTAKDIDVSLSNFEPKSFEGTDVALTVTGSAADLSLAVTEWTKAHPGAFSVPVTAHGVSVTMRPSAAEAAWLAVTGGELRTTGAGTTFTAPHAVVSGVDVGAVGASWTALNAQITMSFGATDPKAAPFTMVVRHAATPPTATVTLAPTDLAKLTGPFTVPIPTAGVTASGTAELTFSRALEQGPVSGTLSATLDGFVPPHPVELDGFLFGKTTTFSTNVDVDAARVLVQLTKSRVRAGAFDLAGTGRIDRFGSFATIQMNLSGNLPCAAVAESAAAAHVGSFLASMLGAAARQTVSGSVGVHVRLSADTRNLASATVEPTIGVGCGLTPLKMVDPKILKNLPSTLQDFTLKAIPKLPDFDLPVLKGGSDPKSP